MRVLCAQTVSQDRFTTSEEGVHASTSKHHWAWYPPAEWNAVWTKMNTTSEVIAVLKPACSRSTSQRRPILTVCTPRLASRKPM